MIIKQQPTYNYPSKPKWLTLVALNVYLLSIYKLHYNKKNKTQLLLLQRMQEDRELRAWACVPVLTMFVILASHELFFLTFILAPVSVPLPLPLLSPCSFYPCHPYVVLLFSTLDPPYKQGLVVVVMGLPPCDLLAIPVSHSPTVPHLLLCMGFVPLSPHHFLMFYYCLLAITIIPVIFQFVVVVVGVSSLL
jgi:hypothetical protein